MTDNGLHKENAITVKHAMATHFAAAVSKILARECGLTPDRATVGVIHALERGHSDLPDIILAVEPVEQYSRVALKAVHKACVKLGNEILLSPTGKQILANTNSARGTAFELIASEFAQALNHHISLNPAPEIEEHLRAIEKISLAVIPATDAPRYN